MDEHKLWNLTLEALAAVRTHYEPVIERFIAESGVTTWGLLLMGLTLEPETTSPARF